MKVLDAITGATCLGKVHPESIDAAWDSNVRQRVERHAQALEACASAMEADGIGGHLTGGHATVLRHMAAKLRADAAHGKLPSIYRGEDRLDATAEPAPLHSTTKSILSQLGV